jgi:NADPH:quinone reductase-like Zn-dependent oxidoreductase
MKAGYISKNSAISLADLTMPIVRHLQAYLSKPLTLALVSLLIAGVYHISFHKHRRPQKVRKVGERVLILGATSGIGRSLARQYAERGARVCIVGRREALVREVETECRNARLATSENDVLAISADFTSAEDMIKVRSILDQRM